MKRTYWTLAALSAAALIAPAPESLGVEHGIRHNIPPAIRLAEPGPMVGGPGPGVLMPETIPVGGGVTAPTVQVLFNVPQAMHILYDVVGDNTFTSEALVVPGRLEFAQGGIYRLKLTEIPGREGIELYPTLEIAPATARSAAFLAHSNVPIQFTEEDFDQALSSNFVTKVIYLPDPEFQGDAIAGVNTLVSTRLEPGLDPIIEADRRGTILAILRLGNKDVEMAGPSIAGYGGYPGAMPGYGPICGPDGMPLAGMPSPPNMVAGVTAPQYGMTYTGTPIGLAGPPHIPLGAPAGLQSHVMKNHTHMNIPGPVNEMKIHVKSEPGQSYPEPPSRMHYREQNIHPGYPAGITGYEHPSKSVPSGQYATGQMNPYGAYGGPGAGGGYVNGEYCPPGTVR